MNYYRYTVSHQNETVKLEVIEKNVKREIPTDNFENMEYNEEGDCILTIYGENKDHAHYIGMWLMQEVGALDREEEEKEEKRQELIIKSMRCG
jgi:hypothetical protein